MITEVIRVCFISTKLFAFEALYYYISLMTNWFSIYYNWSSSWCYDELRRCRYSAQIKNSITQNCTICKETQMRMTTVNVLEISLYLLAQEKPLIVRFVSLTETCSANSSLLVVGVGGEAGSQGSVCFSVYPSTFYCFSHSSVKKFGEICESLQGICQPQNTNWNESRIHLDQVRSRQSQLGSTRSQALHCG